MDRTPLREDFFARAKLDPYTNLMQRLWTDAWALGYETALREARAALEDRPMNAASCREALDRLRYSESFRDLRERALAELTDERRSAEAEALVALSMFGGSTPTDTSAAARRLATELGLP